MIVQPVVSKGEEESLHQSEARKIKNIRLFKAEVDWRAHSAGATDQLPQ